MSSGGLVVVDSAAPPTAKREPVVALTVAVMRILPLSSIPSVSGLIISP